MSLMTSVQSQISNIDDLQVAMAARDSDIDTEVTPITNSSLHGKSVIFGKDDKKIEFISYRNIRARGKISDRLMGICVFTKSSEPNSFNGKSIGTGDLCWVPPKCDRTSVYVSNMEGASLLLPKWQIERLLEDRGLLDAGRLFGQSIPRRTSDKHTQRALADLYRIKQSISNNPKVLNSDIAFDFIFYLMINLFLDISTEFQDERFRAREAAGDYAKMVNQTEEILESFDLRLPTIHQVCDRLAVSRRTLYRAFEEVIGVSPSVYLRNWRLCKARRGLSEGKFSNVTACAIEFGFFDVGRFARYYNELFDELPSVTLAKAGRDVLPIAQAGASVRDNGIRGKHG